MSLEEPQLLVGYWVLALGQHPGGMLLILHPSPGAAVVALTWVWTVEKEALELQWPLDPSKPAHRVLLVACSLPWSLWEVAQMRALSRADGAVTATGPGRVVLSSLGDSC